jgi:drug/metabolite transporter (DMT)-like permease
VTGLALGLILFSAFVHASWNFLLKKSGGGSGLIAAASLLSLAVYAPVVLVSAYLAGYVPKASHLGVMFASGMVHTAYFLLLDRAYRSGGDLSIVYPLARATGPLLTIVAAVFLLGEKPGPTAIAGALLIGGSALLLAGNPLRRPSPQPKGEGEKAADPRHAIGFALLTGLMIAIYTTWDKQGVAAFLIPPLVYDWGTNAFRCTVLIPFTRHRAPGGMATAWRERRKTVVAIALMSPLSYILVLIAMVFTPVSLVAPAREVSILFAALLGAHFLKEGDITRRVIAAVGMVLGISGLALG